MPVRPPYEQQGIRYETTGFKVSVYIEEIRSYVSLTLSNTVTISLAMEHFQNNTEGQYGGYPREAPAASDTRHTLNFWAIIWGLETLKSL